MKLVNGKILGEAAKYRDKNLYIGTMVEAAYYPPKYQLVPELMEVFLEDIIFSEKEKGILALEQIQSLAEEHICFERIHPFRDAHVIIRTS
ncbi:Fic family protein [Blautia sp. XA-2221]|uniref:Fic family protein n=1 Tax=Blautia sp. XA-2221 TaxID=2903961 RepID=UPI002378692B|nr:Fic family protein [Blautia sp. XA-2221]